MVVSFWPLLLFTHSPLMKSPKGWIYLSPFGAVNSTSNSDIFGSIEVTVLYVLIGTGSFGIGYGLAKLAIEALSVEEDKWINLGERSLVLNKQEEDRRLNEGSGNFIPKVDCGDVKVTVFSGCESVMEKWEGTPVQHLSSECMKRVGNWGIPIYDLSITNVTPLACVIGQTKLCSMLHIFENAPINIAVGGWSFSLINP